MYKFILEICPLLCFHLGCGLPKKFNFKWLVNSAVEASKLNTVNLPYCNAPRSLVYTQSFPQTGGLKGGLGTRLYSSLSIKAMGLKKTQHFIMNYGMFMSETANALLTIQWTMKRPTQEVSYFNNKKIKHPPFNSILI